MNNIITDTRPTTPVMWGMRDATNVRWNEPKAHWEWKVRIKRQNGIAERLGIDQYFVRAGSAMTETEARRRRNAAANEFNSDQGVSRDITKSSKKEQTDTLANWVDRALKIHSESGHFALTTIDQRRHSLENHILPRLGHLRLQDIDELKVVEAINGIRADTKKDRVAANAKTALSLILEPAVMGKLIDSNPAAYKTPRGSNQKKRDELAKKKAKTMGTGSRWLTMSEGAELLRVAKGKEAYMMVVLGLQFGLRPGEALGMSWSRIDLANKVIHVEDQRAYIPPNKALGIRKGYVINGADLKSGGSFRDVPIPDDLMDELAVLKERALAKGHEYCCCDQHGAQFYPNHVNRDWLTPLFVKAGLCGVEGKPDPSAHDLRRTFGTWLANYANGGLGVKPHMIAKLMGHKDVRVTFEYYLGADSADLAAAVNSLSWTDNPDKRKDKVA